MDTLRMWINLPNGKASVDGMNIGDVGCLTISLSSEDLTCLMEQDICMAIDEGIDVRDD